MLESRTPLPPQEGQSALPVARELLNGNLQAHFGRCWRLGKRSGCQLCPVHDQVL